MFHTPNERVSIGRRVFARDQGSVYSSESFDELLPQYRITHSMSRAGTPTDNGAMEAINGWMGQGRDVRGLRPVALRRRASVRGILHRILQRGPALGGARLPNA